MLAFVNDQVKIASYDVKEQLVEQGFCPPQPKTEDESDGDQGEVADFTFAAVAEEETDNIGEDIKTDGTNVEAPNDITHDKGEQEATDKTKGS